MRFPGHDNAGNAELGQQIDQPKTRLAVEQRQIHRHQIRRVAGASAQALTRTGHCAHDVVAQVLQCERQIHRDDRIIFANQNIHGMSEQPSGAELLPC